MNSDIEDQVKPHIAKHKYTKDLSQTIKFKYFFSVGHPSQTFMNGDIVFTSAHLNLRIKDYLNEEIQSDNEDNNGKHKDLADVENSQKIEEQE
ncbi:46114_t:CDS:2, partial [Gigaspora margarita]